MLRNQAPRRLDLEALWQYALRALGRRALTIGEMREKLRSRAALAADVSRVLARLKDHRLVDDRLLAEHYASARLENQGHGPSRVLRDLRRRRVAPAVAAEGVESAFRDRDEVELIESFLGRKYRNVDLSRLLADPKKLASAYRRLRYAGFAASAVIRVLKRYSESADELEHGEES